MYHISSIWYLIKTYVLITIKSTEHASEYAHRVRSFSPLVGFVCQQYDMAVVQMVERLSPKQEVVGSSPACYAN